jgi:hypothetical protein
MRVSPVGKDERVKTLVTPHNYSESFQFNEQFDHGSVPKTSKQF